MTESEESEPTPINLGDFVLATENVEGHSHQSFCVGYVDSFSDDLFLGIIYQIKTGIGFFVSSSGYRRCERITNDEASYLIGEMNWIAANRYPVWSYLKFFREGGKPMRFLLMDTKDILDEMRDRIERAKAEIVGFSSPFQLESEETVFEMTVLGYVGWFDDQDGYAMDHIRGMVENPFDVARWKIFRDEMMEKGNEVGAVALNFLWEDWIDPRDFRYAHLEKMTFRGSTFCSGRASADFAEIKEEFEGMDWLTQFFWAFRYAIYQVLSLQEQIQELERMDNVPHSVPHFKSDYDMKARGIDYGLANLLHFMAFEGFTGLKW